MDKSKFYTQEQMDKEKETIIKSIKNFSIDFARTFVAFSLITVAVFLIIYVNLFRYVFPIFVLGLFAFSRKFTKLNDFLSYNLGKIFTKTYILYPYTINVIAKTYFDIDWFFYKQNLFLTFGSNIMETEIILFAIVGIVPIILNKNNKANLIFMAFLYILFVSFLPSDKLHFFRLLELAEGTPHAEYVLDNFDMSILYTFMYIVLYNLMALIIEIFIMIRKNKTT